MIEIHPLTAPTPRDFQRLITGYISDARYLVTRTESPEEFVLKMELVRLFTPYHKQYDHLDAETLNRYREIADLGFSFGAYLEGECLGLALAEPRQWNGSLWVHELHVAEKYRGRGIGGRLVDALALKGGAGGLRTMVCETQNTNVPAIRFYRSVGFTIEGVDISYYTNTDFPDGEIAVFMKKRLGKQETD